MSPEMMAYIVQQMTPEELRHMLARQQARAETNPRTGQTEHYCRGCGQRLQEPPRTGRVLRRAA